jgi:hypothetical protein
LNNTSIIAELLVSYAIFCFGPYLVWPSRWNVVGHFQLGFFFVAYLIPLFWTDVVNSVSHSTVYLYSSIMALGAGAYLLGLPLGFLVPRYSVTGHRLLTMPKLAYSRIFRSRVIMVMFFATLGLILSFIIMGYVPMFAADPLAAKYAHDDYQAGFLRASLIFGPSFLAFVSLLPLLIVVCAQTKAPSHLFLLLLGLAAAGACMRRGDIGISVIAGLGILVAGKRGRIAFSGYLALVILLLWAGTLANYLLSAYFSVKTGDFQNGEELSELTAAGAPDVSEGFQFFESFEQQREPRTYGAQFLGGLIPFQSLTLSWIPLARYSPGFWAMGVLYGISDQKYIRNIGGGGPRIPAPVSGYCAFGWLGAFTMSALSGFITGYLAKFAKRYAGRGSLEQSAIVLSMYLAIYQFAGNPCEMLLLRLVPILGLAWLIYPIRIRMFNFDESWAVSSQTLS